MKKSTMASLIATITALTEPDSCVPRTSSAVIKKMMPAAGRFAIPGVGVPVAMLPGLRDVPIEQRVQDEREVAGPADADGRAPSAYSSTRPHPMIQAKNSPIVAYVYV